MATPSLWQRRVFATLPVLYGALVLGFLPWAGLPVPVVPDVVTVYGIGVLFADLCTAAMLGRQFGTHRRPALLLLTCAYLFSAGMVLGYTLSFNDAITPGRLFGTEHTAAALFLALRLGPALLFVAAVAAETRSAAGRWKASPRPLYLA